MSNPLQPSAVAGSTAPDDSPTTTRRDAALARGRRRFETAPGSLTRAERGVIAAANLAARRALLAGARLLWPGGAAVSPTLAALACEMLAASGRCVFPSTVLQ